MYINNNGIEDKKQDALNICASDKFNRRHIV